MALLLCGSVIEHEFSTLILCLEALFVNQSVYRNFNNFVQKFWIESSNTIENFSSTDILICQILQACNLIKFILK